MTKKKQGHAWRDSGAGFAPIPGEQRKLAVAFPQFQPVIRKNKVFVYVAGKLDPIGVFEKTGENEWQGNGRVFRTAADALASL